jgi:hypothetical protein
MLTSAVESTVLNGLRIHLNVKMTNFQNVQFCVITLFLFRMNLNVTYCVLWKIGVI